MVGWQINAGPDKEARHVTARQMRERLFSPEIIRRAIILGSARKAVLELRGKDNEIETLLAVDPPRFRIVSPLPGTSVSRDSINLSVGMEGRSELPPSFEVIVNNRNVTAAGATRAIGGTA